MRTTRAPLYVWIPGILLLLATATLVKPPLGPGLASIGGMILVAITSLWFWRRRTGVAWRWFWVGAAVWAVAVLVKFAIAIPLTEPILRGLQASLPHWAFLTTGTIYGGAMTGITEVLFTFIAALIWRQMTATAARAVAIGIGAGAIEAALLAIVVVYQIAKGGDMGAAGGLVFLVPVAERLIALLCHTASRALVLLAVARRHWILFGYGFLLLSAVDAVVTFLALSGRMRTMSPWTIEALIAPFGLVSIPITIWCIRHWPSTPAPATSSPATPNTDTNSAQ